MIEEHKDFDNQFFRMVTIALARTMNKSIRWINYFEPLDDTETGRRRVLVPFYTSLTGDERFSLDTFVDDVTGVRVTMNTDQLQRGMIKFNGFGSKSDEFANPNQYLGKKANINGALRKIISKVKAVPVTVNYDIEIQLSTQNEIDKCSQKIMNLLYNYMFFNIDYFGLKIDAILTLPDDKEIEIDREITMDSDRKKFIKFSLDVATYYPIFKIESDDLIVCDNDDEIDWDYIDVPQPTNDFLNSIKNYNEAFGQTNFVGSTGSTEREGTTEIKRVYWSNFFHQLGKETSVIQNRHLPISGDTSGTGNNPEDWNKEDFDGTDVGDSSVDNDID